MSRLTNSLFHKPAPIELRPGHPLSPPDTDIDSIPHLPAPVHPPYREGPSANDLYYSSRVDAVEAYSRPPQPIDTNSGRFRRTSSIAYHNSGIRGELRSAPKPANKWLVVVVPPPTVSREHGSGENNSYLQPASRAFQGLLMPLFSNFHGQLSAIAREFNFPSTSGICIYLQIAEGDIAMSPRVSDESWTILWASLFEDRQHTGLPIAGRIEFDIDTRKARWFDAWVAACRRENDMGVSAPPSVIGLSNHRREDSRTTYLQEHQDDVLEEVPLATPQRPSIIPSRHVPRRLSLLDRADSMSLRGSIRGGHQPATPVRDDGNATATARVLSPVQQEDEPRTAKRVNEIEKKVESWRAVSNPSPPALASTGQTALDPVNIPNTVPLPEIDGAEDGSELNLDDFTWSISSLGPPTPASESIASWDRVESVHLDRRGAGSVLLTPTTCTSFGPSDYNAYSPISSIYRLPSPDIAARAIEDAPMTPMTATSWGPPLELPSPTSIEYAPSVDVAARHMHSRPVTPATATSWGAPLEFPPSPAERSHVFTPGLGMTFFDEEDSQGRATFNVQEWRNNVHNTSWKFVWPYRNNEDEEQNTPSWKYVWPYYNGARSPQPETPNSRRLRANSVVRGKPWRHVWPYQGEASEDGQASEAWRYVWPYRNNSEASTDDVQVQVRSGGRKRPSPIVTVHKQSKELAVTPSPRRRAFTETKAHAWRHVWPYNQRSQVQTVQATQVQRSEVKFHEVTTKQRGYPYIEIYPAVYPHFNLYPSVPSKVTESPVPQVPEGIKPSYPNFSICKTFVPVNNAETDVSKDPAVYPAFEIYPGYVVRPKQVQGRRTEHRPRKLSTKLSTKLSPKYPAMVIYTPVYPNLVVYPPVTVKVTEVKVMEVVPPMVSKALGYPNLVIYPSTTTTTASTTTKGREPMKILLSVSVYPNLVIYPPVTRATTPESEKPVILLGASVYPNLVIYPPTTAVTSGMTRLDVSVYPNLIIYPPVTVARSEEKAILTASSAPRAQDEQTRCPDIVVRLKPSYPVFEIYQPGYPDNLQSIYPSLTIKATRDSKDTKDVKVVSTKLFPSYPHLNIYPPVYPFINIYPGNISNVVEASVPEYEFKSFINYPHLSIYPAVNEAVPHEQKEQLGVIQSSDCVAHSIQSRAPLPPLNYGKYPDILIYPSVRVVGAPSTTPLPMKPISPPAINVRASASYPSLDIYPAVYPYFDLYRSGKGSTPEFWREELPVSLPPKYPSLNIYHPTYPNFDIYNCGTVTNLEPTCINQGTRLQPKYPAIVLYPPVYPNFNIYNTGKPTPLDCTVRPMEPVKPAKSVESVESAKSQTSLLCAKYPAIVVYRPVYPHLQIYPPVQATQAELVPAQIQVQINSPIRRRRKSHKELHDKVISTMNVRSSSMSTASPRSPLSASSSIPVSTSRARPHRTHQQLHDIVFGGESKRYSPPKFPPPSEPLPPMPSALPSSSIPVPSRASYIPRHSSFLDSPGDAEIKRSVSLSRGTRPEVYDQARPMKRSVSLRKPPPEMGLPPTPDYRKQADGVGNRVKKRDSLVLERARAWGMQASQSLPEIQDIPDFPASLARLPPLPPIKLTNQGVSRPISKIDHSKLPFR